MAEPIVLSAELYWRLRALGSDHARLVASRDAEVAASTAKVESAVRDAGLDVGAQYRLDDATLSAVAVERPA